MASESLLAVQKLFADAVKTKGHQQAVRMVIDLVECCGLAFPLEKPKSATEEETAAAIARCFDADWWRRQIRRLQDQVIEHVHIPIGLVNKRKGVYASNFTVGRKQAQWQRNTKTLSMLIATNDLGE
ncbi:MAG: replication endonuclease [Cellvibrionaceae bacterium]|nr:replication endonuclease [Cellvibrionaceae bacterium]